MEVWKIETCYGSVITSTTKESIVKIYEHKPKAYKYPPRFVNLIVK